MRCIPSISRVIPGRSRSVFLASDELLTSVAGCFLKERFPPLSVRVLTFMVALRVGLNGNTFKLDFNEFFLRSTLLRDVGASTDTWRLLVMAV